MKKILALALMFSFATPALAGGVNQFEIAEQNKHYQGDYPPPPPPSYYHKKHKNNNNYDDEAWAAVGGFIGGFILGNMNNGYDYGEPYVPPAYVVPGQPVERCGTVWTMEPDGFGGWQRAPHTVCGY